MCRFISTRAQVTEKKKPRTLSRLLNVAEPVPFSDISSWNARRSSGVAVSGERPRNRVKSRIALRYMVFEKLPAQSGNMLIGHESILSSD